MSESKKLYRTRHDRMVGGVCAGLGRYFSVDPVLVRLVFVVLAMVNGLGVMIYLVLWLVVPDEESRELSGEQLVRANADDIGLQARRLTQSLRSSGQGPVIIGVILIVLGGLFLLNTLIPQVNLGALWPVALIVIGAYLLFARR